MFKVNVDLKLGRLLCFLSNGKKVLYFYGTSDGVCNRLYLESLLANKF